MKTRYHDFAIGLITVMALACSNTGPAFGGENTDSTAVTGERRYIKGPVEYVLWPVATALKLPFKALSFVVSQPVKLVENKSLLPTLTDWLEFAESWGVYPVLNYKSTSGFSGGVGFHEPNLLTKGVGIKVKATYSTNTYRYASLSLGGKNWGGKPYGLSGQIGWRADTRERFFGIGPSSDVDDRTSYGYRGMFGNLTSHWQVRRKLAAEIFLTSRSIDPEDGRLTTVPFQRDSIVVLFAGQDLFGLREKVDFVEYGVGLEYDGLRPPAPLPICGYRISPAMPTAKPKLVSGKRGLKPANISISSTGA